MRLDKFLKVSRLIKRRSVAKEAAASAKITVNGRSAKPSTDIKETDLISIHYYGRDVHIRVKHLLLSPRKEDAESMYEVIQIQDKKAVE
ncbi:MAG: RNA-binding S4 domain-containing protein [Bacilli bacterium]